MALPPTQYLPLIECNTVHKSGLQICLSFYSPKGIIIGSLPSLS